MSCLTIEEVSVLPPPTNPRISVIRMTPQMLLTPAVKEIFTEATLGNAWTNRTPQCIIRTGVDRSIPFSTPINCGMRKYFTPASSDSSRTRIPIVTIDATTDSPCGLNISPKIGDIRQYATPYLRYSNKFYTSIHGKLTNNLVAPPIFTDVLSYKLSDSYSRDLYERIGMHLTVDPVNSVTPQFVDLGFSTVDALGTGASLFTPATRVGRTADVAHWSAPDHIFVETTVV